MKALREHESVERWFSYVFSEGIRSNATEQTYLHFLGRFCKFAGKNPDELIEERRRHLQASDDITKRKHEELVTNWRNQLEKVDGLARGSVVTAHNVIKSFYNANYVALVLKGPKSWITRIKKVPTREELSDMIEVCRTPRDKAVIMGFAQSGISIKDFRELITTDLIREEYNGNIVPMYLKMERQKIKKKYDTFFGKDTIGFLHEYLGDLPTADKLVFDTSKRTIQYIVERASRRAGLKKHVSPHGLRAFFNTFMTLSFLEATGATAKHIPIVEYWMGHVLPYKGAYMVPPVEQQRKIYAKHESAVSISDLS